MDEIVVGLNTFLYDPVAKKITKDTSQNILKEDEIDKMLINKSIFIHNTIAYPVGIASVGTTTSQAIEENTHTMSLEIKKLRERIRQLEIENNQLKSQMTPSMTMVSRLEDFKRCSLEKAKELYKERHNIYINI